MAALQPFSRCALLVEYKVDAERALGQSVGVQVYIQYSGCQRVNAQACHPLNNGSELPRIAHLELTEGVTRVVGGAKFKVVTIGIAVGTVEEGHCRTISVTRGQLQAVLDQATRGIGVECRVRFVRGHHEAGFRHSGASGQGHGEIHAVAGRDAGSKVKRGLVYAQACWQQGSEGEVPYVVRCARPVAQREVVTGGRAAATRAELCPRDAPCPRELYELMSESWRRICSADCTVTPSDAPWAQPRVRDAVASGDRKWVLPS